MKFILLMLLMACNGVENDCDGTGYEWECECVGILIKELEEPLIGDNDKTWFLCCNVEQDSCWYRILDND